MGNKNNYLWIGIVVVAVIVLAIVFISNSNNNSQNETTCNYPYIKVGDSCCLDQNSNNICDEDEQDIQQQTEEVIVPEEDYEIISIESFDYNPGEKKIKYLIISHPESNRRDWKLRAIGKDQYGEKIFEKEVEDGLNIGGLSAEIPYIEGGTLTINVISDALQVNAVGSYPYSKFNTDLSIDVAFKEVKTLPFGDDAVKDYYIFDITNTGSRIIYDLSGTSFVDECGDVDFDKKEWVLIGDVDFDGIIEEGETVEAKHVAWGCNQLNCIPNDMCLTIKINNEDYVEYVFNPN
ncbi:MAG: hypothetical protein ABIF88_03010 [archaeon]|nr:hypothetical protein [Nanoarchaeota archaeon]